jgi:hypothetical protein
MSSDLEPCRDDSECSDSSVKSFDSIRTALARRYDADLERAERPADPSYTVSPLRNCKRLKLGSTTPARGTMNHTPVNVAAIIRDLMSGMLDTIEACSFAPSTQQHAVEAHKAKWRKQRLIASPNRKGLAREELETEPADKTAFTPSPSYRYPTKAVEVDGVSSGDDSTSSEDEAAEGDAMALIKEDEGGAMCNSGEMEGTEPGANVRHADQEKGDAVSADAAAPSSTGAAAVTEQAGEENGNATIEEPVALSLTLTSSNAAAFTQHTFTETIDPETCWRLIDSGVLRNKLDGSWKDQRRGCTEEEQMRKLLKAIPKGGSALKVQYLTPACGYGRVNPKGSLSLGSLRKAVRHTLCGDDWWDFDVANCHPAILLQLCQTNDIACEALAHYVANREVCLLEVAALFKSEVAPETSRDFAKVLFIRVMYGGSASNWCDDHAADLAGDYPVSVAIPPSVTDLQAEVAAISKAVQGLNPEMREAVEAHRSALGKDGNFDGSFLSYYAQEWERRVLEAVFAMMRAKGYITNALDCVLCFDGIMVRKRNTANTTAAAIIEECEMAVRVNLGFNLTFTEKAMTKSLLPQMTAVERVPPACCFLSDLSLVMGPAAAYADFSKAAVPLLRDGRASKKDKARELLASVLASAFGRGSAPGEALFVERCQQARVQAETAKSAKKLRTLFADAREADSVEPLVSWVLEDSPEKGSQLVTSLASRVFNARLPLSSDAADRHKEKFVAFLNARKAYIAFVEAAVPLLEVRRSEVEVERQALASVLASVFGCKSTRGEELFVTYCVYAAPSRPPKKKSLRKLFKSAREGYSLGSLVSWVLKNAPDEGRQLVATLAREVLHVPGATDQFAALLVKHEAEWRDHYLAMADEALSLVIVQRASERKNKARRLEVDVGAAIAALFGGGRGGRRGLELFTKWQCSCGKPAPMSDAAPTEPDLQATEEAYFAAAERVSDPRATIVAFVQWLQRQADAVGGEALSTVLLQHSLGAGQERSNALVAGHERGQVALLRRGLDKASRARGGQNSTTSPEGFDGHTARRQVEEFNIWAHTHQTQPEMVATQRTELKAEIVARMNNWFCAITKLTGKPMVLEEVRRPEKVLFGAKSQMATHFVLRSPQDTTTAWENSAPLFAGDILPTNLVDLWRLHPDKRTCHVLAFEPDQAPGLLPSGEFNLFRGLGIPPEAAVQDDAAAQLVEDHVRTIWCCGDKRTGDFMMNWMAHLVQKPGVKMGTAPVLKGGQGAGKGILIQKLGTILGQEHFISVLSLDAVTGTFQEEKVKTNLLTFLDECTFAGDKRQASILKGLLSEDMRKWEAKFLNPIRVKNHSNFIVASNYDQIVHVEQDDRRWVCLKVDNRYSGPETAESRTYFNALGAVDPRAFAWLLYHRDITTFRSRAIPPTQYGREQKTINFESPVAFVEHILRKTSIQVTDPRRPQTQKTRIVRTHDGHDHVEQSTVEEVQRDLVHILLAGKTTKVPKCDVAAAYALFAKTATGQTYKHSVGERLLFQKIRELTGASTDLKVGPKGAQVPSVGFPPLSKAREAFGKAMHEPTWEWEE